MDMIACVQAADPAALTQVDSGIMRMCATGVLVRGVIVRHLPALAENRLCAITLAIGSSTYTTPVAYPEREDEEDLLATAALSRPSSTMSTAASAITISTVATRPSTALSTHSSVRKQAATFKMTVGELQLLFPGVRRPARELGVATIPEVPNPREFSGGIHITVHSADRNHIFGSALCQTSGEPAALSYPRGEATLHFRVYPCVGGVTIMRPLYNKLCLANTYLNTAPAADRIAAAPAAIAVDAAGDATAAVVAAAEVEAGANATEDEVECAPTPVVASAEEGVVKKEEIPEGTEKCQRECHEGEHESAEADTESEKSAQVAEKPASDDTVAHAPAPAHAAKTSAPHAIISTGKCNRDNTPDCMLASTDALGELVPCYTEEQRRAVFDLYDTHNKGYLRREQVLHFIRSHAAYAGVYESDTELLRWSLLPYVTSADDIVSRRGGDRATTAMASESDPAAPEATVRKEGGTPVEFEEGVCESGGEEREAAVAVPDAVESSSNPIPVAAIEVPRVDPAHLYYRPTSRDGQLPPLEIDYNLFSVIALKLARA